MTGYEPRRHEAGVVGSSPQYEAVLVGWPVALAPWSLEVVSLYECGFRKPFHGDTALLSDRTSDRHQSFPGERLKVCLALPDFGGIYASGDVSQHMRDEAAGGSSLTFRRLLVSIHP